MGATNKTTKLELPLFVGTDKPSWLGDFNGAMEIIDSSFGETKEDSSLAVELAETAASQVGVVALTADYAKNKADSLENASAINYSNATSELEATKVQGAIDEIAARVNNDDLDAEVVLDSYTSSNYFFPADGYLNCYCLAQGDRAIAYLKGGVTGRDIAIDAYCPTSTTHGTAKTIFVKKGMKVSVALTGTGHVRFYALS